MSSSTTQPLSGHVPSHVAIIMDGNNRHAKAYGLGKGEGHRLGKDALDPIVEHCRRLGVQVLSVFAFSSENWQRPPDEVALLMRLLEEAIAEQLPRMLAHDIRMRFIGDRSKLPTRVQALMSEAEDKTKHFDAMTLVIAISYGGRWDMANAAKILAEQVAAGTLAASDIDEAALHQHTALSDAPPVDLLIRTGGEWRISNFFLWQAAYAELYFTDTLWPAFTPDELDKAIDCFAARERRFGQTSEQVLDASCVSSEVASGAPQLPKPKAAHSCLSA